MASIISALSGSRKELALAAACSASATAAWLIWRHRPRLPPGPFAWPLLGTISTLSTRGDAMYFVCDQLREKYGPVVTIWLGTVPCVLVLDPKTVQEVLCSKSISDRGMDNYSMQVFSEGLNDIFVAPNNARWRLHRKLAQSAFRQFALGDQLERFVLDAFEVATKDLESDEPQDIYEMLYLLTYNLQGAMVIGRELTADNPELKKMRQASDELNLLLINGVPADMLPILRHLPLPSHKRLHRVTREICGWTEQICQQHKLDYDANDLKDIVDFFIKEQRAAEKNGEGHLLQDVHLRQTVGDVFFGGTDTTVYTLYFAVRALANFPDMQQRCYEEICSVFGTDGIPTNQRRQQLPFTDAFLHEVQRYWTITPVIFRSVSEDTTVCGYKLAKGTMVLPSISACHKDKSVFANADNFDPRHFLTDDGTKLAPYKRGFLPFGAGARVCPGEALARKTTFLLLVLMVQRFSFQWQQRDTGRGFSDDAMMLLALPKRFKVAIRLRQ